MTGLNIGLFQFSVTLVSLLFTPTLSILYAHQLSRQRMFLFTCKPFIRLGTRLVLVWGKEERDVISVFIYGSAKNSNRDNLPLLLYISGYFVCQILVCCHLDLIPQ